jgi:hypothetical protein
VGLSFIPDLLKQDLVPIDDLLTPAFTCSLPDGFALALPERQPLFLAIENLPVQRIAFRIDLDQAQHRSRYQYHLYSRQCMFIPACVAFNTTIDILNAGSHITARICRVPAHGNATAVVAYPTGAA